MYIVTLSNCIIIICYIRNNIIIHNDNASLQLIRLKRNVFIMISEREREIREEEGEEKYAKFRELLFYNIRTTYIHT